MSASRRYVMPDIMPESLAASGRSSEKLSIPALQSKMKCDPEGYETELCLLYSQFKSSLELFQQQAAMNFTSDSGIDGDSNVAKDLGERAKFLAHVTPFYPKQLREFPGELSNFLRSAAKTLPSFLRVQITQALILLKIHTKKRNRLEWKRLNDLVFVQYKRKITTRFEKLRISGKGFDRLVIEDFQWENEWVGDDPLWSHVDDAMGATNAIEPRNFPRGDRAIDRTYIRRRAHDKDVSSSRLHDGSGSYEEMDEESTPIDDEEVDDYGTPQNSHESGSHKESGSNVGNDLILDEYV